MVNSLKYSLNADEMERLNPDAKVIKYTELNNIETLEELFKDTDKIIILYLISSPFYGHWTCLFKNKYGLNYFDSYGNPDDFFLNCLSLQKRKELNEERKRLKYLTRNTLLIYNNITYQSPYSEACGFWVTYRLWNSKLSDVEFLDMILNQNIKSFEKELTSVMLNFLNIN